MTYRWDDPMCDTAGWYCESHDAAGLVDDSQKVWFPVQVDGFTRAQWADLEAALAEAFPGAEIVCTD